MPPTDSVLEDVRSTIAETLGVDRDEVLPEAHWDLDLGGESIDLLDLAFRLERQVGLKIQIPMAAASDLVTDEKGFLTRETLEHLRTRFPFLDLADWETRPFTKALDLITVNSIARLVHTALASNEAVASKDDRTANAGSSS